MKSQASLLKFLKIYDLARLLRLTLTLVLVLSFLFAWPVPVVHAASLTVNTLADNTTNGDGRCTLREAITAANNDANFNDCIGVGPFGADVITFSLSGTIVLGSTLPYISDADGLTIDGSGQNIAISGNDAVRVLFVGNNALLTLLNLTLTHGAAGSGSGGAILNAGILGIRNCTISHNSASGGGGGIYNSLSATLTLSKSTVSNNTVSAANLSVGGGGISNGGTLILNNTTVSGNSVSTSGGIFIADGGGICQLGGTITINNSTITNNHVMGNNGASGHGGGISASANTTLRNTILGGNTGDLFPDCDGTLNSEGYNLIQVPSCVILGDTTGNITGQSPNLAPLADNGGPTQTHALLSGSPAIDAANPAAPGSGGNSCMPTDQTGFIRPVDGDGNNIAVCDMGAYELPRRYFLPIVRKD